MGWMDGIGWLSQVIGILRAPSVLIMLIHSTQAVLLMNNVNTSASYKPCYRALQVRNDPERRLGLPPPVQGATSPTFRSDFHHKDIYSIILNIYGIYGIYNILDINVYLYIKNIYHILHISGEYLAWVTATSAGRYFSHLPL